MTDYQTCLQAADWRLEQLEAAIATATTQKTRHALVSEANRLAAFGRFCELAAEFDRREP